MGRFGSLFRKSDEKEKAEPPSNPYAQQQSTDAYTQSNSYAAAQNRQAPSGLPSGPRTGLPSGPRPGSSAPPPYTQSPSLYSKDSPTFPTDSKKQDIGKLSDSGYQTGSPVFSNYQQSPSLPSAGSGGYGNDRFGAPAGYGSSRYNNDAAYGQNNHHAAPPQKTTGGYGGLGGGDNELFSSDYVPPSQRNQMASPALPDDYDHMTEEQKQEADINYKKQEIKQLRGETEDSLDRSLAKLEVAHNIADDAMGNLARQRNMLYNANQSLGEAKIQARVADANVKDLQDANKSMFNFYAMSRKRRDGLNDERLVAELQEKEEKQQMMREIQQGKARTAQRMQDGQPSSSYDLPKNDRSKYLFESSDEDEQAEARIEDKQTRLAMGVGLLHRKAVAMGDEVDDQNPMIEGLSDKTSRVHDKIIVNKNKLDRFK